MKRLFWLHDECLRKPADLQPKERWIVIWDTEYFNNQAWSLKRQVFIYETLCALAQQGCEVVHGESVDSLLAFHQQGFDIVTQRAQDPILHALVTRVQQAIPQLTQQQQPGLVDYEDMPPPKRFFHFWNKVETSLLGEKQKSTHHRVR